MRVRQRDPYSDIGSRYGKMVGGRRTARREDGKESRGKSEENEHSGKVRGTGIGDRTFLDTKDGDGARNGKRKSDVVRKSERDHRGARKRGRTTVFLRADREGDIDRPCAGRRTEKREKEGERRCQERERDRE